MRRISPSGCSAGSPRSADDEAPWVKIGDACLRAKSIRDEGTAVTVRAEVRDTAVARALESLRPDGWGGNSNVVIATSSSRRRSRQNRGERDP
jgi:hypothetical protein